MADDDVKAAVQRMIDAGESPENIRAAIRRHVADAIRPQGDTYKGPDTFWGGVKQSIMSGEAPMAGLKGAAGFLKGATYDIPSSVIGGLSGLANLALDPVETIRSIPGGLSDMWETTKSAGSQPFEFGEMMGQITGQPAVTAAVAPPAIRGLGRPVEATGRLMRESAPFSQIPPRWSRGPGLSILESKLGGQIEGIGQRMRAPTLQGEAVTYPSVQEGQVIPEMGMAPSHRPTSTASPRTQQSLPGLRQLPEAQPGPSFYHPESMTPPPGPPVGATDFGTPVAPRQLGPAQSIQMPEVIDLGQQSPTPFSSHQNSPAQPPLAPKPPRTKLSAQGNKITDKATGEVVNKPHINSTLDEILARLRSITGGK